MMENSDGFKQQYEDNQQEMSLMQQQYQEAHQSLVNELDSARKSESKLKIGNFFEILTNVCSMIKKDLDFYEN